MKNEQTSPRVSSIAGRILDLLKNTPDDRFVCVLDAEDAGNGLSVTYRVVGSAGELKALAASGLTQASDKPKRKKRVKAA